MRTFPRQSILLIALLTGCILLGCSADDSPEEQIAALITQAEEAVEDKRIRDIRNMVAEDYSDDGGRDKKELINYLVYHTLRQQSVYLFTRIETIEMSAPDAGRVTLHAALTGRPVESASLLPGFQADLYRFELDFHKKDDQWLLRSAHWEPAEVKDLLPQE